MCNIDVTICATVAVACNNAVTVRAAVTAVCNMWTCLLYICSVVAVLPPVPCSEKYTEEIKTNNKKENGYLVKMVVQCVERCMDKVNELLHERGHEDLVEPFTRTESG